MSAPESARSLGPGAPWTRLFVGRESELARLRDLLLQSAPSLGSLDASRTPQPTLAVLIGDSGQGKSRLVQEFYRRIACRPSGGGLDPEDYWPDAFADPGPPRIQRDVESDQSQEVGFHFVHIAQVDEIVGGRPAYRAS